MDHDRDRIIDATYGCLSEPHTGPIPVAAILARAGVSTRAFYRHFASKDELFLAMLRHESDALAGRLDCVADRPGDPVEQLRRWIETMFGLAGDARLRAHLTVLDSAEVRAADGYQMVRERAHADRERSLVRILERGRRDGSFPLACPDTDALAISAVVSRVLAVRPRGHQNELSDVIARVFDFSLRALGVRPERGGCPGAGPALGG